MTDAVISSLVRNKILTEEQHETIGLAMKEIEEKYSVKIIHAVLAYPFASFTSDLLPIEFTFMEKNKYTYTSSLCGVRDGINVRKGNVRAIGYSLAKTMNLISMSYPSVIQMYAGTLPVLREHTSFSTRLKKCASEYNPIRLFNYMDEAAGNDFNSVVFKKTTVNPNVAMVREATYNLLGCEYMLTFFNQLGVLGLPPFLFKDRVDKALLNPSTQGALYLLADHGKHVKTIHMEITLRRYLTSSIQSNASAARAVLSGTKGPSIGELSSLHHQMITGVVA